MQTNRDLLIDSEQRVFKSCGENVKTAKSHDHTHSKFRPRKIKHSGTFVFVFTWFYGSQDYT